MQYEVLLKPRAIKDLTSIPKDDASRIVEKLELARNNLSGEIKKLTNFEPNYRLRVGNWRVLFEIDNNKIEVYRILHRKEAYR